MEYVKTKDLASCYIEQAKKDFASMRLEDARLSIFSYIQNRRRLGPVERTLFNDIFQYRINYCRTVIDNIVKGYNRHVTSESQESIAKLKRDLQTVCVQTEAIVQTELLPYTFNYEARIFYSIIQADCFKIMCEILPNKVTEVDKKMGFFACHCAYYLSIGTMEPTHDLRITTGIKFALYYYKVYHNEEMAKKMFTKVIATAKQFDKNDNIKKMISKFFFFDELRLPFSWNSVEDEGICEVKINFSK